MEISKEAIALVTFVGIAILAIAKYWWTADYKDAIERELKVKDSMIDFLKKELDLAREASASVVITQQQARIAATEEMVTNLSEGVSVWRRTAPVSGTDE